MDWITWIVIASAIGVFLGLKRLTLVAPARARECLKQGALIIDVRTKAEFQQQHLPGAINLPLDQLRDEIVRRVPDKSQALLLHCLSGTRSGMGKSVLKRLGYQSVFNLGSYGRAARIVDSHT